MNSLGTRDALVSPSLNKNNACNTSNKRFKSDSTTEDYSGCPSRTHFDNTSYTLGFGHLFSGSLQCYQSVNPIRQCYEPGSFEAPEYYHNTTQMDNIQLKPDPIINIQVDDAMKTIRKKFEKQCNYSIPSVPTRCNPMMNNCNQNNIAQAAALLERAANAMSTAANTQNQFRSNK